ncbi:MAG: late competence development ComFB family protein [Halothiobacillaceae bacterium]
MFGQIQNYYETLVFDAVREKLADAPDMSDELLEDIACVTLNSLPPRYLRNAVDLVSHMGDVEEQQLHAEVDRALERAVETVRRRHSVDR